MIPLTEIPDYEPDGPINVIDAHGVTCTLLGRAFDGTAMVWPHASETVAYVDRSTLSVVLDATGRASLARAGVKR